MGKVQILTQEQEIILDKVKQNSVFEQFYFTGGTALSACYLHHRYSEDLDFFSEKRLDTQSLLTLIELWSKEYNFTFTSEFKEVVYSFLLTFKKENILKIDFAYYPYKNIKSHNVLNGMKVNSITDIAVNKLLTISQRTTIKDFVDLYFLLQQFSLWDLIEGLKIKFHMKLEPYILASDFLKVEDFTFLPRMIKPLTLEELKLFYRKAAQEVGRQSIE